MADIGDGGLKQDDGQGRPEPSAELRTVRLLRFPLRLWLRADEHYAELMREFALLAIAAPQDRPAPNVPARLLALVDQLTLQYAAANAATDVARDEALARGELSVELIYRSPVEVKAAAEALHGMLAEADEYCRAGQDLLTLAAPSDVWAFVDWYLGEFGSQIDGRAPVAWPGPLD